MNGWGEINNTGDKIIHTKFGKGEIIHIPAFWWYSIEYEKLSSVCSFQYRTFMNVLAISPHLVLAMLQGQNIKRDIVKKVEKAENKNIKKSVDNET